MFESLSDRLQNIIRTTSGQSKLTDENMQEAFREIRRAFLEADVSLKVVKSFISNIREKAEGQEVLKSVSPTQQLIKIVNDEMVELLGGENKPINLDGNPAMIMMLGLQGSGKTTSAAKLAVKLKKDGKNPLLVACDVYRPAAITQLQTLGKQTNTEVYTEEGSTDVVGIVRNAKEYALNNHFDVMIIDTAGRLQIDTPMMAELLLIDRTFNLSEKLLVIDSMIGQEAVNVAQNFDEQLSITGIVLTKLDGDSRGGAALSVVYSTCKPIKFTGMGEKLDALDPFYPERMAQRILGMGDIVSLVEKAQENFDEEQAKELEKKMRKKEFTLEDFMNLQKQLKMLGSFGQILNMLPIPGLDKNTKDMLANQGEKQMKRIESVIKSMTLKERQKPETINVSRKKRIAKGSGIPEEEVTAFLKQFEMMRQMMQGMTKFSDNMKKNPIATRNMMHNVLKKAKKGKIKHKKRR
ncbi:MAG: signal recognition particle protein [Candidatus Gastranaerophilales bacterium]|nr:signal recognition particle protein [Candidatus Gastranaerophilales bacterium]